MRLIELRAENFKRLTAVTLRPTGAVTPVIGKNGAGKTSVLDAIACALGGANQAPAMPIRKGKDRAVVVVDLGDVIVTRKWTAKTSTLEVATKDGAAYKSPQAVLDKVFGDLSFDPLGFARMPAKDQAATLARVAGIDLDLHRTERQRLYDNRTAANRTAKELRAAIATLAPLPADVPDAEVPVSEIVDELTAAEEARRVRVRTELRASDAAIRASRAGERIERLRADLDAAEREYVTATAASAQATDEVLALPPLPDTEAIKARGKGLEELNRQVRAKKQYAERELAAAAREAEASRLTDVIALGDRLFAEKLAAAALPIPGLSIDQGGVCIGTIPFAQCSGAEQLRTSVAIGFAINPTSKLMLIRDGSLLDADGMALLAEMAEAAGAQVLIERVDNGSEVGVRIVDGGNEADDAFPVV